MKEALPFVRSLSGTAREARVAMDKSAKDYPKVWIIQNILAPYRIPLFRKVAQLYPDFELVLLAEGEGRRQWKINFDDLPFKYRLVTGLKLRLSYEYEFNINPSILFAAIRGKPDIIIAAGFSVSTILVILYKVLCRKKVILWFEGYDEVSTVRTFLRRLIVWRCDAYIVAGQATIAYLQKLLRVERADKTFLAYNCVDNEFFASGARTVREDHAPGLSKQPTVLYVGQFLARKGVMDILNAFALLKRTVAEARLVMVGDGPLKLTMETYIKERGLDSVWLPGFVSYDDLPEYYGMADVFVLPCYRDHNPFVLLEAMASGVPVVVTNGVMSSSDFVQGKNNGYVVNTGDVNQLYEGILRVLTASDWKTLSRSAQEVAFQASYDAAIEVFESAISMVVN